MGAVNSWLVYQKATRLPMSPRGSFFRVLMLIVKPKRENVRSTRNVGTRPELPTTYQAPARGIVQYL